MTKCFCDRCGKETKKLKVVEISAWNPGQREVRIELCDDCQSETGVLQFLEDHASDKRPIEKTAQDEFFDLFRDMVASVVSDMQ